MPNVRRVAVVLVAGLLSACASIGGKDQADITGDSADEVNWAQSQTAVYETEIARLKSENAQLERRVAELERDLPLVEEDATEESGGDMSSNERIDTPPLAAATAIKPEAVVAAADADKALAGSPEKPVEPSPRLVQPSFASGEETVFENEAPGEIKTASVLFGVHLASYRGEKEARAGWRKLQRENPDELGLLEPRIELVAIEGRGDFLRLIGGGFSSRDKADELCGKLKTKGTYCAVTGFEGERLSLADANG